MLQTTHLNVMETECQPTVCKSAHQSTAICLAFSSFPASVLTLLKIKRSLTHLSLNEMIPLILCTPGRHAILQVFSAVLNSCQPLEQEDYLCVWQRYSLNLIL